MAQPAEYHRLRGLLTDWRWRLNNLYWITDKEGRRVKFTTNWAQEQLFEEMHFLNLILKARQLGFTTFIQLFMLDACLFNANLRAGTIAHTLDDARRIFRDKIRFPYDNLPEGLRGALPVTKDTANELILANNSGISVGVSMRSGTLQYLHISEFGKVCAKYPDKAREIITGALNTIQAGQVAFIESTAEGQEGAYYDLCSMAQATQRRGDKLTSLDWKFFFFPWWRHPEYRLDPAGITIDAPLEKYFSELGSQHGIQIDAWQQAWYAKKAETQQADMKREYPSTAEEAFEASVEGAYYADQLAAAELQGRIGDFPHHAGLPVHTAWDIGVGDSTVIWFWQITPRQIHVIDYCEASGEGAPYYLKLLDDRARDRGYRYGDHWLPHDAKVKEWGSDKTRLEQLIAGCLDAASGRKVPGIKPRLVPDHFVDDGINAARAVLPICCFDKGATADGVKALKAYRKDWDERLGVWKDQPRHDWASHGADGFRYLAIAYREIAPPRPPPPPLRGVSDMTIDELWAKQGAQSRRI